MGLGHHHNSTGLGTGLGAGPAADEHHDHRHDHAGAGPNYQWAFAIGIILNGGFVVAEAVAGFLSGSMALVADAGHNLSDVLGLIIAWIAATAARRPATNQFTYGMKSSGMLAAFANGILLVVAIVIIGIEAVQRMLSPAAPDGQVMIWVAGIGVVINLGTALMFMRGRRSDINVRGAYVHMASDALVSLGVVVAGVAILYTNSRWIDPLVSLSILAVIGWGTWGLLRDSVRMGLLAVPEGIDCEAVRTTLVEMPGVSRVEDLHIWPMSSAETALTAHLVMPEGCPGDAFLRDAARTLAERHGIGHTTLQVERGELAGEKCG